MPMLIVAALVWIGLHLGLAGTQLREVVVRQIGQVAFRGLFSVLSILALIFLVIAWNSAPSSLLWYAQAWLRWLLALVMLPACILLVASLTQRNPTMVGPGEGTAQQVRGITRVTRHPMLWAFSIWAVVHMIGNGDTAAIIFFAPFLITAVAGMASIDRKLARRDPAGWQTLSAESSIVPFAAIVQGRNHFVPGEIGWLAPILGVALWIVLLIVHPWLFAAAPVAL